LYCLLATLWLTFAAAITTDYDTLLQVFPTQTLVADAQRKLEALLDSGKSIEEATQEIYDLLIQQSNTPPPPAKAAAADLERIQAANIDPAKVQRDAIATNITELMAQVDNSTLQRVSERRVEFYTVDGFPCLVLATADYSAGIVGGSKCRRRAPGGTERLLLHSSDAGATQQQQQQQQQQFDRHSHLQGTSHRATPAAAAAAAELPSSFGRHNRLIETLLSQESGSSHIRSMLQASPQSQCARPKGLVLVLSPFYVEHSCEYGDESAEIASLFRAAGYDVTFKCNDLTVCLEGPPSLDDYIGWSKYVYVAVVTIGDADVNGESPIILARAPTNFSDDRMRDWQAGRMVLTGDGLFALR
jgi:hypothetical protein